MELPVTPNLTSALRAIRIGAFHSDRVAGLTHCYYKYPARFSPRFVRAVVEALSAPNDLVLDPYMGGGTTIVEAMSMGRRAVGCDLNSLAVFVAKVKTTPLSNKEILLIQRWTSEVAPQLSYRTPLCSDLDAACSIRTKNMEVPRARAIKKYLALAISTLSEVPSKNARDFLRCVLLNAAQAALNGNKRTFTLPEFRSKVTSVAGQMLRGDFELRETLGLMTPEICSPLLVHDSATSLPDLVLSGHTEKADLVVTSPPYPGVHILYHRWQVDGRKETPAPYWIADKLDGKGTSYYNFGTRKQLDQADYFASSLETMHGIRGAMKDGAYMVQMIAFSDPKRQLPRYLKNMIDAGFAEARPDSRRLSRIWRHVPGRSWHAELQGRTSSAREVVLVHKTCQ